MYNFSRTQCLRAKLGMSVFCFATGLIVHDRIETYENHEDEKSFGFMIIGSIISSIVFITALLYGKLSECIEDGCTICHTFWISFKKYGVRLMCTFIFVSLECPSLYFLTQSAYLSLHFPSKYQNCIV